MFLIRNAEPRDFKALFELARLLNSYNLPADPKFLKRLLRDSHASFRGAERRPERMRFLFAAEEIESRKVVGCSLIIARHGTPKLPHLSFRLGAEVKKSKHFGFRVKHTTLELRSDSTGFTELGGLVVLPEFRNHPAKIGKQLSYARFAYMAWFPKKFRPNLIVEYLPNLDGGKGNHFWTALGEKFTGLAYRKADRLSAANKEFITSLFPKEKIYVDLLPRTVLENMGVPGPGARASVTMLERIGFKFRGEIDPLDGGPHYGARLRDVSIVKRTIFSTFYSSPKAGRRMLAAIVRNGNVQAIVARCVWDKSRVCLPRETSRILGLTGGEKISFTPF